MNAIDTNVHLRQLLNDARGTDQHETVIETVLVVLQHTVGLWEELRYAYKGAEIATRCRKDIEELQIESNHWKREEKLKKLRDKASHIIDVYFQAQQRTMGTSV